MINPQQEQAKKNALNYRNKLQELGIKENIVKLPQGYGSAKTEIQNYKRDSKDKPEKKKGSNIVNSLDISRVGRLHEKGFTNAEIAKELGVRESKVYYRLKLYNDGKTKQKGVECIDGNLPEKPQR